MKKLFTTTLVAEAVVLAISIISPLSTATAAELDLPTDPLITSSSVEPNLMILLDTSGSMSNIVPDSPYDENIDYYNCPSSKQLDNNRQIDIRIRSDGRIYFYRNGSNYDFGQGNNRGTNNLTQKCFNDDTIYTARLLGDSGGSPSSYLASEYTGNYLNWYFSNSTNTAVDNFGNEDRKPGTKTRMEIARTSAATMVEDLIGMRVGLATYNGSNGAKIQENITSIETNSDVTTLQNAIGTITNGGGTPLGGALSGLGHYFAQRAGGSVSGQLTLHPDNIGINKTEKVVNTSSFFSHAPSNSSSPTTDVITNWCQSSYVVAMTDGIPTNDTSVSNDMKNYFDGGDIVDDVTRAMYEIDLRPDLTEGTNNVTTYMVGFADTQVTNNSLIRSAATEGGGEYLTANNSDELVAAFQNVINSIVDKLAAGSGVSFNTSQLTSGSSIYAASFDSGEWSGSLKEFDLSTSGTIQSETWDAATKLDALTDYNTRNIFSYNSSTKQGIVFNTANIASAPNLLADLKTGPLGLIGVSSLINYLKGDMITNVGTASTNYRERSSRLGDIVNSTVVNVSTPELNWPNYNAADPVPFGGNGTGQNYSDFKNISRTEMLYVGANDGMLHGFNAADGEEKFAYIPSLIASDDAEEGLHYLANSDYEHRFYVDSTPTVSDVYFNDAWHTVLVSGLRSGGKGLFALDITDPTTFDASVPANADLLSLWEFGSDDDPDFGYIYGEPTIAKMANGEWVAIVGNGYNNSGDGHAKLFIIYIDKNGESSWIKNNNYKVIDTGAGSTGTPNGLSTPRAVDLDGDSVIDRVYAGDLQGNMWAFDVSNSSDTNWEIAHQNTSGVSKPLFTAEIGGTAQPITTAPIVANNTNPESGDPDILVFFGTGKYIEEADKNSTDLMSYYGVLDNGTGVQTRTNLTPRELYSTSTTRVISGSSIPWSSSRGWYFDFEDQANSTSFPTNLGERVISNTLITNNVLLFNTVIPTIANSDICTSNSESWIMAVDLNTGKAPDYTVFDINNDNVFDETTNTYDIDNDGDVDGDDLTSHAGTKVNTAMIAGDIAILGNTIYSNDVDGNLNEEAINIERTEKEGRLSWEELVQ
ncbi:PilC/PilY family type IV pilus protein [Psychromonas arctica]|uniref:PilC/PilY family type IV pilus protein n=1 Tax=Psychromonas arctica TaxID=168275 RepID=A0ABU9HBQ7_9GAMM